MKRLYVVRGEDGEPRELAVERDGRRITISFAGSSEGMDASLLPDGRLSLVFEDGRQFSGRALASGDGVELTDAQGRRRVAIADPLRDRVLHAAADGGGADSEAEIHSQMPGRVVEIKVAAGDRVESGSVVLVLEAMEMQNEIRCDRGGIVERVEVQAGQPVDGGALLAVVRAE